MLLVVPRMVRPARGGCASFSTWSTPSRKGGILVTRFTGPGRCPLFLGVAGLVGQTEGCAEGDGEEYGVGSVDEGEPTGKAVQDSGEEWAEYADAVEETVRGGDLACG